MTKLASEQGARGPQQDSATPVKRGASGAVWGQRGMVCRGLVAGGGCAGLVAELLCQSSVHAGGACL